MPTASHQPSRQSLREALRQAVSALERAHTPSASLAAELLLMHVLGCDRAWLYAHGEKVLSAEQSAQYSALLAARAAGRPTQYLTGKQEFWGLELEVTPAVLIPRPETEHLIEVALGRVGDARRNAPLAVADIGTGSGCVAIALAKELPRAQIQATDISPAALEVARRNAARHGFAERIHFSACHLLEGVAEPQQFDLIVSNPPYIALDQADSLPADVREHEPHAALFAGSDGLALYAPLVAEAQARLRRGGMLVMEIGEGLFEAVSELLDAPSGWTRVSATLDLAGVIRVISCAKD
jgi:release factor glutamine methyltransferase